MKNSKVLSVLALGLGAVALPLLAGGGLVSASAPSANQMVPVAPGISAAALPHATAFGTTPPWTPETVSFVLTERNLPELESSVQAGLSSFLSVPKFAATYGQSTANIQQLQAYLGYFGIRTTVYADDVDVVANGTAGQFDRALGVQQEQYNVPATPGADGTMGTPAQTVHGTSQRPELPYRIAQYVTAILGLTNYGPFVSQAVHTASALTQRETNSSNPCLALTGLPDACNLPQNFATNYGLQGLYGKGADGAGQTAAIVTLAGVDRGPWPYAWAPQYFWQHVEGLRPSGRSLTVENIDGGPGAPSYDAGSTESDLDVEQAGGLAPQANIVVYQAPNTDYGYADAFFTAASQNLAGSVSASWGESETAVLASVVSGQESPGYAAAFDEAFLELAAQGQSTFVAAGDSGAYDASGDIGTTNLSVDTPADSPYVTAAGGTTLAWSGYLTDTTTHRSYPVSVSAQRAWGWDYLWLAAAITSGEPLYQAAESAVVGGGGGFSRLEPAPTYQAGVSGTTSFDAVQYLTPTDYQLVSGLELPTAWAFDPRPAVSSGGGSGRAVPDLSADADPYSGYLLYSPSFTQVAGGTPLEGGWGGTSFVGPQLNGSAAVIDSYLGHRVGLWNPSIYAFAKGADSPFTQLSQAGTGNDNIYFTGHPGALYNEAVGLGYPNLTELAEDFG